MSANRQSLQEWHAAGGGVPVRFKGKEHLWHSHVKRYARGGDVLEDQPFDSSFETQAYQPAPMLAPSNPPPVVGALNQLSGNNGLVDNSTTGGLGALTPADTSIQQDMQPVATYSPSGLSDVTNILDENRLAADFDSYGLPSNQGATVKTSDLYNDTSPTSAPVVNQGDRHQRQLQFTTRRSSET